MANRYDRDPDDYGFGRRDSSRDEDDHRPGQYAQNRAGEQRPNIRQNPWRDVHNERNDRDRNDRTDQDYRARSDQDRNQGTWRGNDSGDNNHYSSRENYSGRENYSSSGRDMSGSSDRERSWNEQRGERHGSDRGNYRGLYQEQVWTRDPSSGNVYGYEYSTRLDPRRFNSGDERQDRWRSNVNEQNHRFDIDRGWHTPGSGGYGSGSSSNYGSGGYNPGGHNSGGYGSSSSSNRGASGYGTSGYGNAGVESQYGRGPKGYVRSDERIREDVCDRLSDDDEIDARDVTVTVKNADVILEGSVNDRRSKHRAEDIAESVSGVKNVTNHLRARKGFLQELGDKISGDDEAEHHGHRGSGTRNNTTTAGAGGAPQKTSH